MADDPAPQVSGLKDRQRLQGGEAGAHEAAPFPHAQPAPCVPAPYGVLGLHGNRVLEFVFGLGVDQVKPEVVVVLEMAKTSGGGQQTMVEPKVLSTKSQSAATAARALSNPAGLRTFWSHAYVF